MTSVAFWDEFRGGAPGGTFATVINAVRGKSITAPRGEFDPFLRLSDGSESEYKCQVDLSAFPAPSKDPWSQDQQQRQQLSKIEPIVPRPWTAPFVMAMVNGQVVRWSYALRGQGSKSLVYTESALHPNFQTAFVNYVGLAMFGSLLFNPLTCYLVEKYMIPKPGDGPSMDAMERKRTFRL